MRQIAAVTAARSDLGIYLPLFMQIRSHPELDLRVVATGMHLSSDFGRTVDDIEKHGFEISARVECLLGSDTPAAIAKSIGIGVSGFGQLFAGWQPDILLLLGDRFDMFPLHSPLCRFGSLWPILQVGR